MAEVSLVSPLMYSGGRALALEDILITSELTRRQPRAPDFASENRALVALAREIGINPRNLPQTLVDLAVDLCRAGSAGISVLKADADGEYIAWKALSGVYAPSVRRHTPRYLSPCGTALDRKAPQLFSYPARYFTHLAEADVPIVEGLVIPLSASGQPLGTIWLMTHDEQRHFDAEDVRLVTSLAAFARAAQRVVSTLEAEAQSNQTRRGCEEPRQAAPQGPLSASVEPEWSADTALDTGE